MFDGFFFTRRGYVGGIILLFLTLAGALFWHDKTGPRHAFNFCSFIQITVYCAAWTAHTGGLSASLYGAAYLSLVPVALIIPRTRSAKVWTTTPVVFLAVLMSCFAQDAKREYFICLTSMLGTFVGVIIRGYLTQAMKPVEN